MKGEACVYFLKNETNGLVKIGTTTNLKTRKYALEHQVGSPLELIASVPGDRNLEQTIHKAFGDIRQFGEWFLDASHLRSYITALCGISDGTVKVSEPPAPPVDPYHPSVYPKLGYIMNWVRLGKVYEASAVCSECIHCDAHRTELR